MVYYHEAKRIEGELSDTLITDECIVDNMFVLSQGSKQREVLSQCTKFSIDNNHECAPFFAERTLSMRGTLRNICFIFYSVKFSHICESLVRIILCIFKIFLHQKK